MFGFKTSTGLMTAAAVAAAMCTSPAMATDTTVYVTPPDADTYIAEDTGGQGNFGASTELLVESAASSAHLTKRTLLRFDLTDFAGSLPIGATITDASLKLWMTDTPANARIYDLFKCDTSTWNETDPNGVTWLGSNAFACAASLSGATLIASQTVPGSAPQAMTWTSTNLTDAIIAAVGSSDHLITMLVKDSNDEPSYTGSPPHPTYTGTFLSKEGATNTYPTSTDAFQPVLAITYHVDDVNPPTCDYPVQIVSFTLSPGESTVDTSSFDVEMVIHACQALTSVKAQGGTAGNTDTTGILCDPGTCEEHSPGKSKKGANNNVIITWLIDSMDAEDDATLDFTVTTGNNPADIAICQSDVTTNILKNITGAWSVTATYDDGGTPAQYTTTHGPLVTNIFCGELPSP